MAPRPDVSEERKAQIMNAAEEIFIQKGFGNARMEDIAEQTGLSKGTLYLYYKSKDDLIIAILDRIFQRDFQGMDGLGKTPMTATESLWKFVELATAEASAMMHLLPITYEFLALAFRDETVHHAIQRYFAHYGEILAPIIQQGMHTGEFRQVDPAEVAIAIGAIFEGTIVLWAYNSDAVNPARNIQSSITLLLEGIQAAP